MLLSSQLFQWILLFVCLAGSHCFIPVHHSGRKERHTLISVNQVATYDGEDESSAWESSLAIDDDVPYTSSLLDSEYLFQALVESLKLPSGRDCMWDQVKREAQHALGPEPSAGPQLYQGILSHKNCVEAVVTTIAHEIETELMPATAIKNLFLEALTTEDELSIHLDVMAVAMRSPSVGNLVTATLFHKGFHALVCYRVGHRLWNAGRTGLAHFMQSTVSMVYSADIHPAATMGSGLYLNTGGGVVIGETAVVGDDVSILQGVTLGGSGKETGDRHPKVGNGVLLHPGATVLGNIKVGDGAVVMPKSIVTKPVPPLARVTGVPAKIHSYREATEEEFERSDLERHLKYKYMESWQEMAKHVEAIDDIPDVSKS